MRSLFIISMVIMSLVSFPSWGVTWDDLVGREGLIYEKFSDIPFTGVVDEGLERGSCKNGKMEGSWVVYHNNGQLISKGNYKNGKREGSWKSYWSNGQLSSRGNYRNGKMEGSWEFNRDDGKIWKKGDYKNGKKEGFWEHYNPDGSVWKRYTGTFKNGVKVSE